MAGKFKIPVEYQYLLEKKNIDQKTVEENKDLRHIFSHVPKNVPDRIRRNLAVISLHYANEYIQSKVPLFTNGVIRKLKLNFVRETNKVTVYRFDAEVLTPDHRKDDDYKQIPPQEFVALKENDVEILSGRVYKSTKNLIRMKGSLVMSKSKPSPMPKEGATVNIYKAVIDFVPAAITKAIETIQKGDLDEFIHPKPSMTSLKKFLKELDPQVEEFVTQYPEHARLNKEQKTAVYVISKGLHKPHPFVLFGPPGTGKTVTIIAAVVQLMKQDGGNRVLICTPSNTAADRVAKELLNHLDGKLLGGHNVLRLCSRSADFDHRDTSVDVIANIGAGEYEIPESFKNYRIIITTLATSVRLLSETFTHIIADEAGQALEAEIWIPLGCCATKDTSVVLCGDPNQLGPVNILNFPQKFSNYLECPLNWYLKMTDYAIDCRLCVRLVDCFRCHGHIVKIASNLFYKRRLRDAGDKEWKNKLCCDPSWFNGQFPIAFIDPKKSVQHKDPEGTSVGNHIEAKVVCKVLKYLNEQLSIDFGKIGVVSPYKYHSKLIREKVIQKFNQKVMDALTVDSVERFQGSEREVIIITTARTQGLGFLSCDLRLNTAITRAQRLLIVIGKKTNLEKHGSWKKFISYVDENNSIYPEFPVVKSLSDKMLKLKVTDTKN